MPGFRFDDEPRSWRYLWRITPPLVKVEIILAILVIVLPAVLVVKHLF